MKSTLSALLMLSLGVPALTGCSGASENSLSGNPGAGHLGADPLATGAAAAAPTAIEPTAATNLVVNGGFEAPWLETYGWDVFSTIPGWKTVSGPGIEIQAWDAFEGRQIVELDSHLSSAMEQSIPTTAGNTYELSFEYSPRAAIKDNRIGVYWGGTLLQIVDANGVSNSQNQWTRYTFRVTASSSSTALRFADLSVPDGLGGHLDDVRVVEVAVAASHCGQDGPGRFVAQGSTRALHLQHTATLLPDGSVLATGGFGSTTETFNSSTGTWSLAGYTTTTRRLHTATLLTDGRVLVAGGDDAAASGTAELYDPVSRTWSITGALRTPRRDHQAALLQDGRVLVMGGMDNTGKVLASAELYDPSTGLWTATGSMKQPRRAFSATSYYRGGQVLAAGGVTDGGDECTPGNCLNTTEAYNPSTGTWYFTSPMTTARAFHSAASIYDGYVLVSGGSQAGTTSQHAELFIGAVGEWRVTGDMAAPRRRHSLTALPGGWILAAGGYDASTGIQSSAELFDPSSGSWCPTASMLQPRYDHTATALPDGRVLITAGFSNSSQYTSEVYDPGVK